MSVSDLSITLSVQIVFGVTVCVSLYVLKKYCTSSLPYGFTLPLAVSLSIQSQR